MAPCFYWRFYWVNIPVSAPESIPFGSCVLVTVSVIISVWSVCVLIDDFIWSIYIYTHTRLVYLELIHTYIFPSLPWTDPFVHSFLVYHEVIRICILPALITCWSLHICFFILSCADSYVFSRVMFPTNKHIASLIMLYTGPYKCESCYVSC